ncbi:MAG TPA: DMT family transporter [Streptosporangiaceae bacterium]|nr:DMT family transporter [Streptosporangiaceae bacterium]
MQASNHARLGLAVAVGASAAFSTSGALAKSLIDAGWSPAAAVTARVSIAAIVLAVPALISLRGRWQSLRRSSGMVIGYGALAVAGAQLCYFNALQHLPVGVALMLEYMGTVLVVLWMWIRHGHRPRRLTLWGSAASLTGLALVLGVIGAGHLDVTGVAWALGAAVGLAAFFVLASGESDLPPVALASTGMGVGALLLILIGVAGVLPMHATFNSVTLVGYRVSWLVPVACLSLVAAVVAYLAGIIAARMLGAKLASFVGLTEVICAVLIAWILLGQLPTAMQLAGGALIVAGIALVRIDELRAPSHPQRAVPAQQKELVAPR